MDVWLIFDPWNEQLRDPSVSRKSDCEHYHGNYPDVVY